MKTLHTLLATLVFFMPSITWAQWFSYSTVAMTTPIKLVFWTQDTKQAQKIRDEVFEEIAAVETRMSRYIESSELSIINRDAFSQETPVSSELVSVLQEALTISDMSAGAFDITYASVGALYDYRKKHQPNEMEIKQHLESISYHHVDLDINAQKIRFRRSGVILDLGGIAKGYAVDRGINVLARYGIQSAYLSAGGDMRLLGDKQGKPWIIGIQNPRDQTKQSIILPLTNTAMSTSGDYERFFIDEQGERVHHILSPKTGKPVKGVMSVSILAPTAMRSDGLSTAVFVMGVKAGLEMINRLEGIDAIIIAEDGKVHFSQGLLNMQEAR